MKTTILCSLWLAVFMSNHVSCDQEPALIAATWEIGLQVTDSAWEKISEDHASLLDAVEESISESCEINWCGDNVGAYWKVDEQGDLSLDAMIMDGATMEVGAVGNLRNVRAAISVARAVMDYTGHTFIAGGELTDFAEEMGFPVEDLRTNITEERWEGWKEGNCQPNFRKNVEPDPSESCGPYAPIDDTNETKNPRSRRSQKRSLEPIDHDTVCELIIDRDNDHAVVGTSTNGLSFKIPGRVGDTPIPGAGGYALNGVGAAIATGDGDIMLRFLPTYQAVESMRLGMSPAEAAADVCRRMHNIYPDRGAAVIVGNVEGEHAAACSGSYRTIDYAYRVPGMEEAELIEVDCEESREPEWQPPDDNSASGVVVSTLSLVLTLAYVCVVG